MRALRVIGPSGLIVAVALLLPASRSVPQDAQDCAACHEEVVQRFAVDPHGRSFEHDPDHAGASCASCHGPGQAHIDGDGDPALIVAPRELPAEAANRDCLVCHGNQPMQAWWSGSAHEIAGLACVSCHRVHAAQGRERVEPFGETTELCLSCHTAQRGELTRRSSHPLRDGSMNCASCHNPHGAPAEHTLKGDSLNDLCFQCHQEKRGPFLWEHAPVREDCLTCHVPHGSNHDMLLASRPAQLCQSCHLQGRHQTLAGLPSSMWNVNRQCLNCHSQVHGSNHPSGPLFHR